MSTILNKALDAASGVANVAQFLKLSDRPLPSAPDGLSDAQAAPAIEDRADTPALAARVIDGIKAQLQRGAPLTLDAVPAVLDALAHANTDGINDRLFLLEDILGLMSRLPPGIIQQKLQDYTIGLLYDALPHPPVNFLPASIPLPDYQVAQDPEATRRVKTGFGEPTPDPAAGAGAGASAGASPNGNNGNGNSSSSSPTSPPAPENIRRSTAIPAIPAPWIGPGTQYGILTPPSSQFSDRVNSTTTTTTTTTIDGLPPSPLIASPGASMTASMIASMRTSLDSDHFWQDPTPRPSFENNKKYSTQFRTPTGAGNNPHMPLLGASNTPYARSVPSVRPIPPSSLPDPGVVFDALLRRTPPPPGDPTVKGQGHGQPHPSGISTLMFAFATLIVHTLFRTGAGSDKNINLTSSYLDLSVLYGSNEQEMDSVRRKDGTGRIWQDTWADSRILGMVPAVGALLVVFSRNHNYVATKLLEINEKRTYAHPSGPLPSTNNPPAPPENPTRKNPYSPTFPDLSKEVLEAQDDDIFNRTRLINCAFFMNVIIGDYLSAILGTFREGSSWCLNPLEDIRKGSKTTVKRAEGNVVSVEFNLLYRWHATLSDDDEKWLKAALKKNLPDDSPAKTDPNHEWTERDFGMASASVADRNRTDPRGWTFGTLIRQQDGSFESNKLAEILHKATSTIACGFGPRGIPAVLKPVEVMGIKQARNWGVCTLNEFRHFMGLKKFESFEEWCGVSDVAKTAQRLYGHIDNLELYVGMQAEQAKPPRVGAGLCPGFTVSRAILADAVNLTRGDRFLTTDLTPFNLTAWGFQDAARDTKNGSMGGAMCKLLFRTLPQYYPEGSIYAHFPFITPNEMGKHLRKMGILKRYKTLPPPTTPIPHGQSVNTLKGVQRVLQDMRTFKTVYGESMEYLTNGYGFFLAFDEPSKHAADRKLVAGALRMDGKMREWVRMYQRKASELIEDRKWVLPGVGQSGTVYVDVVRDVLNIVPVHWVSEEIAGIPLKSKDNPKGIHTEQEVYQFMAVLFTFIFLNMNPETSWPLRENAKKVADVLRGYIKANLEKLKTSIWSFGGLFASFIHLVTGQQDNSHHFLQALLNDAPADMTVDQLASNVIGLIVGAVANWATAATHVINFYLDDERSDQRRDIESLARDSSAAATDRLAGYVREALRFDPQAPGVFRDAMQDVSVKDRHGDPPILIKRGERIFVSLARANMDPAAFENPEVVDPSRPREAYSTFGRSEHTCLGNIFTEQTIPAVMRAIFSKRNVRRAPGQSGKLNRFRHNIYGTESWMYMSAKGTLSPWPASMVIQFDE